MEDEQEGMAMKESFLAKKASPKKLTIKIATFNPPPLKCDLCGKRVPYGRMLCGGPFHALCKTCESKADKAIDAYVTMISQNPLLWLAKTVMKKDEERKVDKP